MSTIRSAETPLRDALVTKVCCLTVIDKIALGLGAAFLFLFAAIALTAHFAIGDAPEGRLWGFLLSWAAVGFGIGIAGPWALCRSVHAGAHAVHIYKPLDRLRALRVVPSLLQNRTA